MEQNMQRLQEKQKRGSPVNGEPLFYYDYNQSIKTRAIIEGRDYLPRLQFLFFFLAGLAFNAKRGYGPGLKPLQADLVSACFTDTILAAVDPRKGLIDLLKQLLLSPPQPEDKVVVELSHRLVGGIGKAFLFRADLACQGVFRLGEEILPLLYKLFFDN